MEITIFKRIFIETLKDILFIEDKISGKLKTCSNSFLKRFNKQSSINKAYTSVTAKKKKIYI